MGAVSYNQAVDNYLDEKLGADKKPNDKPYKKGAYYTGKEHSWDEAFGYFGAAAHTLKLTPEQSYNVAKMKDLFLIFKNSLDNFPVLLNGDILNNSGYNN